MSESFALRVCPLCGSARSEMLFSVTPRQFASANPTYRADYAAFLGVAESDPFPIARCGECGFVFAGLSPSPEFLTRLYEQVIRGDAALRASEDASDLARRLAYLRVLTAARKAPGARALDFGAGFGATSALLAACGFETVAYDNSASRRESIGARDAGVRVVMDAAALQAAAPFDALVVDNVLEHIADPAEAVDLLASVSRPGAMLFIGVPACEPHEIAAAGRAAREGACDLSLNPWEHLNYFSRETLDRLLARRGFHPLAASALGSPPEIGLRPESAPIARFKNALAACRRLFAYARTGRGVESVNARFYVYAPE